jgi:hypothetical protein
MMGVLARLVARATGQAPPALRPRLRSRFEGSPGTGLVEEATERAAPPASPSREAPVPHETRREEPPLERPLAASGAAEPLGRVAEEHRRAAPIERETPTARPRAPHPAPPPALMPAEPLQAEAQRPAPAAPTRGVPARVELAREPTVLAGRAPPLLLDPAPPSAIRWPEPSTEAVAGGVAAPPVGARAASEAPTPEISIHIGRIELRSDAPKPERAARRTRPAVPSLGDYLRGKGSGG